MTSPVLSVQQVHKLFAMGERPIGALWRQLSQRQPTNAFPALTDVCFEVGRGESLALVGRNGSGKSTLLQIIAGTMQPSSGAVRCNGKLAALLELGAGFNPDFTGADNVRLNAQLLGMTAHEVDLRFDEIAAFADLGQFLYQPIKTWSSGMLVRLAFSVAAHTEPDVFIVDEALSVGDEAFQRKCIGRIQRMREAGTTLLFVSHSAQSVLELCDRAILLDEGHKVGDGEPKKIIATYQKLLYAPPEQRAVLRKQLIEGKDLGAVAPNTESSTDLFETSIDPAWYAADLVSSTSQTYGAEGAAISRPVLLDARGYQVNLLRHGEIYRYAYDVHFSRDAEGVRAGCMVRNVNGVEIAGLTTHAIHAGTSVGAGSRVRVCLPFKCQLLPGTYFLNAGVVAKQGEEEVYLQRILDALMFRVMPEPGLRASGFVDLSSDSGVSRFSPI